MKNNRVVAVTGGLSGIGKGTVLELAKRNYTIVILDIQDDKAAPYKETEPTVYAQWAASNPAGRLGMPWEIGHAVAFLFEDDSAFINGVVLPVDSGFCAGK